MAQYKPFTRRFTMDLNESVAKPGSDKKEHKKIGEALVPFPALEDFGIQAKAYVWTSDDVKEDPKNRKEGETAVENGIPVYDDPVLNWLQVAVVDKVKAYSRNRFKKGELKPGLSLAEDFEALTAESARTGEALKLRREAKDSFQQYLAKLGKKQETIATFGNLFFTSSTSLASAGEKYLEALEKWVGQWVETLTPEQTARFAPKLTELSESLTNATKKETIDDAELA